MSKSGKHKEFHLTPAVIIRLIIFFLIVGFFIYYFSTQAPISGTPNQNVLGTQSTNPSDMPLVKTIVDNLYKQLPPDSQKFIENINNSPILETTLQKLEFIKIETNGFPQKQLKDFKLYIINKGQGLLKSAADKTK